MRLPTDLKKWARPRKDFPIVCEKLDNGMYRLDPYEDGESIEVTGEQIDEMAYALNIPEGHPSVIVID